MLININNIFEGFFFVGKREFMSKYVSSNEYFDNIKEVLLPNKKRNIGSIPILKEYGNIQMNYFNMGSGINYSSFVANFHEDTVLEGICSNDVSFLRFNTGNSMYIQETPTDEKLKIDENTCYNGKESKQYKADGLYPKNKQFILHSIRLENDLFDDLMKNNKSKIILKKDSISLNFNNYINIQQKNLLKDIEKAKVLKGKLKEIYLESKNTIFNLCNC